MRHRTRLSRAAILLGGVALSYIPNLSHAEIGEAARHNHAAWGGKRALEAHAGHLAAQISNSGGIARYVGVRQGRQLVASLKRYDVTLDSPWGPLEAIGIGAVYTGEAYRGRGHASRLTQLVMDEAKGEGAAAAMLYSDIDVSFYERLGFVVMPHVVWTARVDALPDKQVLDVRACKDIDTLLPLYRQSWDDAWVRMRRSADGWRYWAWRHEVDDVRLLSRNGQAVGYVASMRYQDSLWLPDIAVLPDVSNAALWATLRALAIERGAGDVSAWLRADRAGGPFVATVRTKCIPMVANLTGDHDFTAPRSHFAAFDHF
jgi:predicted N-acetyltransferase YhbS